VRAGRSPVPALVPPHAPPRSRRTAVARGMRPSTSDPQPGNPYSHYSRRSDCRRPVP
jgi:hypothetical protein